MRHAKRRLSPNPLSCNDFRDYRRVLRSPTETGCSNPCIARIKSHPDNTSSIPRLFIELPCLLVYPVVIWTVLLPGDAAPSAPSSITPLIRHRGPGGQPAVRRPAWHVTELEIGLKPEKNPPMASGEVFLLEAMFPSQRVTMHQHTSHPLRRHRSNGFTLTELMTVIAVIGVLVRTDRHLEINAIRQPGDAVSEQPAGDRESEHRLQPRQQGQVVPPRTTGDPDGDFDEDAQERIWVDDSDPGAATVETMQKSNSYEYIGNVDVYFSPDGTNRVRSYSLNAFVRGEQSAPTIMPTTARAGRYQPR